MSSPKAGKGKPRPPSIITTGATPSIRTAPVGDGSPAASFCRSVADTFGVGKPTQIRWAHAINTRAKLTEALQDRCALPCVHPRTPASAHACLYAGMFT